jgi:hypothetical protein
MKDRASHTHCPDIAGLGRPDTEEKVSLGDGVIPGPAVYTANRKILGGDVATFNGDGAARRRKLVTPSNGTEGIVTVREVIDQKAT